MSTSACRATHQRSFTASKAKMALPTDTHWTVRWATVGDGSFMADMLVEAVNWSPERKKQSRNDVLSTSALAHYIVGWPRHTDVGVIAEANGERIGAAWLRILPVTDPG